MPGQIYNDSFYYSEDQISYFITSMISDSIVFYQDISNEWWQSVRNDDAQIRKYVTDKFARDFYPRVVVIRKKQFDLDYDLPFLKSYILSKIGSGQFSYKYEPEKTLVKTTHVMHFGVASILKDSKRYNPRLAITVTL